MEPARAGLFIYAKDLPRMRAFYQAVLDMRLIHGSDELVVLQSPDMQLLLHAIPPAIAASITISVPPQRREEQALKFFFTVPSIDTAKGVAASLGGEVRAEQWQGPGFKVSNACDPEGNLFHLRESTA